MIYIAKSKIPSRHANSIQVVNMICALAPLVRRLDVYLPGGLSRRWRAWRGSLFSRYNYSIPENVRIHICSDRKNSFEANVIRSLNANPKQTIFTRSIQIAQSLTEKGFNVLFESHVFSKDAQMVCLKKLINGINKCHASGIIAISHTIADAYTKAGLTSERILTVPDGADLSLFSHQTKGGLGKIFGQAIYRRPIMVYTGSLSHEKGAHFLARLAGQLAEINVAIIGGSRHEARSLEKEIGNGGNLFIHQNVPHNQIPTILQDAEILAMPYIPEGELIPYMSPLKLFEYLASGKTILSADLPVLRPFLVDHQNCILFTPGSSDSFCDKAREILALPLKQRTRLQEQQLLSVKTFSWANRAKTILDWHLAIRNVGTPYD